jgi:hypothetical protein
LRYKIHHEEHEAHEEKAIFIFTLRVLRALGGKNIVQTRETLEETIPVSQSSMEKP